MTISVEIILVFRRGLYKAQNVLYESMGYENDLCRPSHHSAWAIRGTKQNLQNVDLRIFALSILPSIGMNQAISSDSARIEIIMNIYKLI